MDDKRFFLERIVNENSESKILVFVRTKVRAERVKKAMGRVAIESITIHGDKDQRDRNLVMNQFKSGDVMLLIATDVSARGIDIPDVDIVINYDLPDKDENYVHRVGRTGRGKNKGNAYTFCSKEEEEMLVDIQEFLGEKIEVLDIGKKEYFETIDFSNDTSGDIKSMLKEIEEHEKGRRKKNKKKKR